MWCDLDDEVVERPTRIFASHFEDQVPARTREESQPLISLQNLDFICCAKIRSLPCILADLCYT